MTSRDMYIRCVPDSFHIFSLHCCQVFTALAKESLKKLLVRHFGDVIKRHDAFGKENKSPISI